MTIRKFARKTFVGAYAIKDDIGFKLSKRAFRAVIILLDMTTKYKGKKLFPIAYFIFSGTDHILIA